MGNKHANDGGEPMSSKKVRCSKQNKDHILKDDSLIIDSNVNGVEDGGFGEEVEESLQRGASNNQGNLVVRLPDPPVNLETRDVGLSFQLKMLKFMDSMRQEIKCGKEKRTQEDKMIELLMMQGIQPSSSTKKLAKVKMPSTFLGLGKARKVKEILLEMDNYYDVQKPKEGDKVSIAVSFLKDYALQWWTSKKE